MIKILKLKNSIIILIFFLSLLMPTIADSQERIKLDGYWWGTISFDQKLGYVQGFMDGSDFVMKAVLISGIDSKLTSGIITPEDAERLKALYSQWSPFDHTFDYYLERIESFYKTTNKMTTPLHKIMMDLMTPMPNP